MWANDYLKKAELFKSYLAKSSSHIKIILTTKYFLKKLKSPQIFSPTEVQHLSLQSQK